MDAFKTINHVVTSPGIGRSGLVQGPGRQHESRSSSPSDHGDIGFGADR